MKVNCVLIFIALLVFSCKSDPTSDLVDLDLMSKGIPLKIKAPVDAKVVAENMGVMKDITIQKGSNFYIQILSSNAVTNDKKKIISEEKAIVERGIFFSKIIQEDEFGFIFEKKIDSTTINHDFRFVKIQGDKEYLFQTGLIGNYSVEDVQKMYAAVQ